MVDERLTTVSAASRLSEAGVSAKDQRKKIDSAAAVAILENGIARERG
jgi:putative Holliday junction resolvase